jgi:hypothetical protein
VEETSAPSANRHPRVFLSHSAQDKERFARKLAIELRDRGADVWFDEWELLPGDSLVDKIFEEGLRGAEAFLVVLSQNSVSSRWVREELNAAVVKRIEQQCKLIPVVLDDVEVPEALRHTVWQSISDPANFESELDQIVRAIYGIRERPPLGRPPGYTDVTPMDGLSPVDTRIVQVAGSLAIEQDEVLLASRDVLDALELDDISENAFLESLEVLEGRGYVKIVKTLARGLDGMSAFSLTTRGLHQYAQAFITNYDDIVSGVASSVVNSERSTDREIAEALSAPRQLVENILDLFQAEGWIRATKTIGPATQVFWASPELRRRLQQA